MEPKESPPATPTQIASTEKLLEALANAQGEFPVIPKDSEVIVKDKNTGKEIYRYKYADLTTIISHTRPALYKNGLGFTQGVVPGGFSTLIFHKSGQTLKAGYIPVNVPGNADMKSVAGMVTYVKRISLGAALGVSADEDVDAAAVEAQQGNSTAKAAAKKDPAPAAKAQASKAPPAAKAQASKAPPAAGAPKVNFAPASAQMIRQINQLCADRGIDEGTLQDLITHGYGFDLKSVPTWVANEVGKLLSNEDTTTRTITAETQRVATRREAARIKNGGES